MIRRGRYWREVTYYYNHSTRLTILPLSERKPRLACSGCNGKSHRYIHKKIGVTVSGAEERGAVDIFTVSRAEEEVVVDIVAIPRAVEEGYCRATPTGPVRGNPPLSPLTAAP